MARRPNLFIVGAPKSGTTSLYEYLTGHPQVFMSPVKEPQYYAPDVKVGSGKYALAYPADDARYAAYFADAGDRKWVGEASTHYLYSEQAAGLIHTAEPDARIIVMLRDPIEMLYSLHNEYVSDGVEANTDFAAALAASGFDYKAVARYGTHLKRWLALFPRDQIHVIVFDDFSAETPAEFRKVLEFLQIDPTYQPASFDAARKSHRQRAGVLRKVTRSRPVHWAAHDLMPRVLGEARSRNLVWRFRQSRVNRRPYERPPVAQEVQRELHDELRGEVEKASHIVGRDLVTLWGFK